jgi:hypothetical protein
VLQEIWEKVSDKQNQASREVTSRLPNGEWKIRRIQVILQHTMVNKAKSQELKKQILRQEVDVLKAYAVKIYLEEQHRSLPPGEKKRSLHQICNNTSDAHFAAIGRSIPLDHNTLLHHAKGGVTLTQSNRKKSWLTVEENENIVQFAIEMAQ